MCKDAHMVSTHKANLVGTIAVAYTLWSYKKGAGKKIMKELQKYIKDIHHLNKMVTLSPLTPMATHYHISNGARLLQLNPTTQNFEYKINGKQNMSHRFKRWIVRLRMWYADIRGHHGKKWNYESSNHYMKGRK